MQHTLNKSFQALILLGALSLSGHAAADFVHTDWKTLDDQQATLDTDTGLEWLKLSMTTSLSINDVQGQLGTGGNFEGWRLPTQSEVSGLLAALFQGVDIALGSTTSPQYYDQAVVAVTYLGNSSNGAADIGRGWHVGDNTTLISGAYYYNDGQDQGRIFNALGGYSQTQSGAYDGVFLVSDGGTTYTSRQDPSINGVANVSVPFAYGALLMGGLAFAARRRQG